MAYMAIHVPAKDRNSSFSMHVSYTHQTLPTNSLVRISVGPPEVKIIRQAVSYSPMTVPVLYQVCIFLSDFLL